ncbi:hypothetical protein D9M72_639720 [compost metagenome]
MFDVLRGEARFDGADVALGKPRPAIDRTGQEAHAQRAPRHESDAQLRAQGENLLLWSAPEH